MSQNETNQALVKWLMDPSAPAPSTDSPIPDEPVFNGAAIIGLDGNDLNAMTEDDRRANEVRQRAQAEEPNQPLDGGTIRGMYDTFPAKVVAVYYDGADPPDTPTIPANGLWGMLGPRPDYVMCSRVSIYRDLTYKYPVEGPVSVGAEDDSVAFMARPAFGLDCPDYYVKVGDIVTVACNRAEVIPQHVFWRDEDPFVGKVTAVSGNAVTVNRAIWSGDPDGGGYAGPAFNVVLKDQTGTALVYANVLMEEGVGGSVGTMPAVSDPVIVWRRGRHMLARPVKWGAAGQYLAVCIDAQTIPALIMAAYGDHTLDGNPFIDVVDSSGVPIIPGPTRKADGTYIPCVVTPSPCEQTYNPGGDDVSPYQVFSYEATGPYLSAPPEMIVVRKVSAADSSITGTALTAANYISYSHYHLLDWTCTGYTVGAAPQWKKAEGTVHYRSAGYTLIAETIFVSGGHTTNANSCYPQPSTAAGGDELQCIWWSASDTTEKAEGDGRWVEQPFFRVPVVTPASMSDIGDIPVLLNTTDGDLYVKGAALPAAAEQGDFIVSGAGGPHDWIVLSPPGAGGDYSLHFAAGVWTFVAAPPTYITSVGNDLNVAAGVLTLKLSALNTPPGKVVLSDVGGFLTGDVAGGWNPVSNIVPSIVFPPGTLIQGGNPALTVSVFIQNGIVTNIVQP